MVRDKAAIFIFTRNRAEQLGKGLKLFADSGYPVFIIDDSTTLQGKASVQNLACIYENVTYVDNNYCKHLVHPDLITGIEYQFLTRDLGNSEWNLGYARNIALLIAKKQHFQKVLFADDDITVDSVEIIDSTFSKLDEVDFFGRHITGKRDNSIVGHIAEELGHETSRMISGGFMAFLLKNVKYYFLNVYNEDWIWLYLHLMHFSYELSGEATQEYSDILPKDSEVIQFQEVGEILLDGIIRTCRSGDFQEALTDRFWYVIVDERKNFLEMLRASAVSHQRHELGTIISKVLNYLLTVEVKFFSASFRNYYSRFAEFEKLYGSL